MEISLLVLEIKERLMNEISIMKAAFRSSEIFIVLYCEYMVVFNITLDSYSYSRFKLDITEIRKE